MPITVYNSDLIKYFNVAPCKTVCSSLLPLFVFSCIWLSIFVPLFSVPTLDLSSHYSSVELCIRGTHIDSSDCNQGSEGHPIYTMCYQGYIDYQFVTGGGANYVCSINQGESIDSPDALVFLLKGATNGTCSSGYYKPSDPTVCRMNIESQILGLVEIVILAVFLGLVFVCVAIRVFSNKVKEFIRYYDRHPHRPHIDQAALADVDEDETVEKQSAQVEQVDVVVLDSSAKHVTFAEPLPNNLILYDA